MSRWTDNFKSHGVHQQLSRALAATDSLDSADPTLLAHAGEVARFKKVLTYLEQAVRGIDPELVPLTFWDAIRDLLGASSDQVDAFKSSKSVGHMQNANQALDQALLHARPYLLAKGRLGPALQAAAKAYSEALTEAAISLEKAAGRAASEIDEGRKKYSDTQSKVDALATEIVEKYDLLLTGTGSAPALIPAILQSADEIKAFHTTLSAGQGDVPSLRQQVVTANEAVQKSKESTEAMAGSMADTVKNLTAFEARMLGTLKEDGKREGGVNHEIGVRLSALQEFEREQLTRYSALNQQIESLLPGATSAGLATAYKSMRDSFSGPIRNANRVFYASVAGLVVLALVMNIDRAWLWGISFQHPGDWQSALRAFVNKLPFIAPLVWLAYYASKRRSEFQRLEQEYAHKEALAMSYDSYRTQIEELGREGDPLMRDLLAKAVDAIAFNASGSLDGKHGDKIPMQELLEKLAAFAVKEAKKPA